MTHPRELWTHAQTYRQTYENTGRGSRKLQVYTSQSSMGSESLVIVTIRQTRTQQTEQLGKPMGALSVISAKKYHGEIDRVDLSYPDMWNHRNK